MEPKDLIKSKREELKLTLEELGNLVGVGKSTVRKWETGQIENMKRDNIIALSKALHISPSTLIGWDDSSTEIIDSKKNKISIEEQGLLDNFNKLNTIGKKEAIKRVSELTYIKTYTEKIKHIPIRTKNHLTEYGQIDTMAAHNDFINKPGEIEKIMEDFNDMDNW